MGATTARAQRGWPAGLATVVTPARLLGAVSVAAGGAGLALPEGTGAREGAIALLLWPGLAGAFGLIAARARLRVAVLGDGPLAGGLGRRLEASPRVRIEGWYTADAEGIAALLRAVRLGLPVGHVLLAVPERERGRIARLAAGLAAIDAEVAVALSGESDAGAGRPGRFGRLPVMVLRERAIPFWGRVAKRAVDLGVAAGFLLFCAPVLLLIALAIRLDGGPALFRQSREGLNGTRFSILKFRTMRPVARGGAPPELRQTARDDARVTRVGRWLRRSSLDELPQLINVMRGEMSLLGPRPHVPELLPFEAGDGSDVAGLRAAYARRHRVRPGMSGLAQVRHSRGALEDAAALRARLALDLEYVDRWTPGLELKVALLTPLRVVFDRGAAY